MKKTFFLSLLVIAGMISYAQCDKKFVLTSSKTEYLNATNVLQRTVDEMTTIEVSKSEIIITPGAKEDKLNGTIKSATCDWKVPFKEGKTIIKALITDPSGDAKNVTITLKGKDGKLIFLIELDDDSDKKIRVAIDKVEEKN